MESKILSKQIRSGAAVGVFFPGVCGGKTGKAAPPKTNKSEAACFVSDVDLN